MPGRKTESGSSPSLDIAQLIPDKIPEAIRALEAAEPHVDSAKTYDQLEQLMRWAEAMRIFWSHIEEIRRRAERIMVLGARRAGEKAAEVGAARGGRPGKNPLIEEAGFPTLTEMFGSRTRGSQFKKLSRLLPTKEDAIQVIEEMHAAEQEATVSGVLRWLADEEAKARRAASRAAPVLIDGMDLRIGDCRTVLADIADNSVALILTDPPYEEDSEDLYRWLGQFAARVLVPGGSMICFTGHYRIRREMEIFDQHLRYWWLMALLHTQARRFPGKFVFAGFKPVLWYVKDTRRSRNLVSDVLRSSSRDKTEHEWGQGEAGVTQLIEDLTDPRELIVDPFAGSALWGRISATMGRYWIGADIVQGGSITVQIEDIPIYA